MDVTPNEQQLWEGIGGHFDSFTQVVCEFVDNSIANFEGNSTLSTQVLISLEQIGDDRVKVRIEDTGTGISNFEPALRLGDRSVGDAPLNEHGFGMKHALASTNPDNDSWKIYTRTQEDFDENSYRAVEAPYTFDLTDKKVDTSEEPWPGRFNDPGTIVEFEATSTFFNTVQQGIRGNAGFERCIAYLKEDLGYTYAGVISNGKVSISLNYDGTNSRVEAVTPTWEGYYDPKTGTEEINLGSGEVTVEYTFGEMQESDYAKYYKRNMSTSGVEIRVNGRAMVNNIFPEIWRKERHNKYNHYLAVLDLQSEDLDKLPKTRTAKNGIRSGDEKLERLFDWIRNIHPKPQSKLSGTISENELVRELAEEKERHLPKISRIECEFGVYDSLDSSVPADMYVFDGDETYLYEAKKNTAGVQSVYQLLMYWDGAVADGHSPDAGILVAADYSPGVDVLIDEINNKTDDEGNIYNFEKRTWKNEGIDYPEA